MYILCIIVPIESLIHKYTVDELCYIRFFIQLHALVFFVYKFFTLAPATLFVFHVTN